MVVKNQVTILILNKSISKGIVIQYYYYTYDVYIVVKYLGLC